MKLNWFEIRRKLWHIAWGVFMYFVILNTDESFYKIALGIAVAVGFVITVLMKNNVKLEPIDFLIKHLGREGEGIEGSFYYVIGVFVSSLFFEQRIVALSALALGVCDGIATIFGVHGKNRIYKKKTLEGTGAFFVSCFLIIYLAGFPKSAALIAGIALSLTELFTDIDDNLIIPAVFSVLLKILG